MNEQRQNKSFVSAQRVARLAGVSRSAVSRTFTDGASVSDETRKKVMKAAEVLGYHVNHLARGLIQDRSNIVCLIVAELSTPFQSKMLEAATRKLQEINKVAMVINTSGEAASVQSALRQTLNYRADATVVLSGSPAAALIDTCLNNGQHVILINRQDHFEGPENIFVDNETAAQEAFSMLHRAGCRKLAVVTSEAGTPSLVGRERAFEKVARDAGVSVRTARFGPTSYASGAEVARMLLSGSDQPDGVFCITDLLACGFMDAARTEFGLGIPEDLCVVGFDDIDQSGWASYNLTTFRQPIDQIADHIVNLLSDENRGVSNLDAVRYQALPVWRKSVRPR